MYVIRTSQGNTYNTDDNGAVISRSNGPEGWDYGQNWVILGTSTRHNAHHVNRLADVAADAGLLGQGWVHDVDHGQRRMWGNERAVSVQKVGA